MVEEGVRRTLLVILRLHFIMLSLDLGPLRKLILRARSVQFPSELQ